MSYHIKVKSNSKSTGRNVVKAHIKKIKGGTSQYRKGSTVHWSKN